MAVSTKTIKSRLRSIGNTKKITKAMEMVAAAKMRKAVGAVLASRSYSDAVWRLVLKLVDKVDRQKNKLLRRVGQAEKIAVVLITSNRGLCGGFNSQIIAAAKAEAAKRQSTDLEWIVLGKVGAEDLAREKRRVVAQFDKADVISSAEEILPLTRMIIEDYRRGRYDQVLLAYTDFISPLVQKPKVRQLLPIENRDTDLGATAKSDISDNATVGEYIFEPSAKTVLDNFLPRLVESQIYQAVLESNASEHSARMMAMKNASESANEMIDALTLAYNQARQAGITREIAEISGGKAALE